MNAGELADGAVFDARLGSVDAENVVLLDRCEHLLEACRAYKASITPSAPRGALSALGGVLAVLQAGGDTQDTVRAADVPEARLATALERLTDESDAGVPLGHDGLAAPLAASLGAPLLSPLAEALRAVGARRAEHATELQKAMVDPVNAFVQNCLRGVEASRYTYGRRRRDADIAREAFLRSGGSDPRARAAAAEAHADASLARDAARAALAAAVCHAEGARRHAVLSATVAALQAMREHALCVVAEIDSFGPALEAAQAYAAQAAAQAEKRAAAQSEANEAFMTARQAETEASKVTPDPSRAPMPNDGRSDAGAALRQSMASHREASQADAEPPPLKESYLMLRAAGGWHKRYFALTAGGTLAFHRTRTGALAAVHGAVMTGTTSKKKQQQSQSAVLLATAEEEAAHDSENVSGDDRDEDDDATALARAAIGSMWSMGSSLLRGAVSGAVSGARSLAETAGELATAAGQRVTAPSSGAIMLLTASIKMGAPETDAALAQLPFIFRVMTPVAGGSLILQAESAAERASWVAVLQGVVAELLTGSGRRDRAPAWASLRAAPGNSACADCGAADPDWASLNLCVVLCQHCAGAHRRLGAAASAVRSLTLDEDAWTPAVVALFAAHGNTAANAVFAAMQDGEELRPDSPMEARLEVVRAKYVDRQYVDPSMAKAAAQPGALSAAAAAGDVAAVLRLLAAGADSNGAAGSLPSPLAAAAAAGSLLAAQALLLNGADPCVVDADAATPADLAASFGGDNAVALQSLLQAAAARRAHGRTLISASAKASDATSEHAPSQEQSLVPPVEPPFVEPTTLLPPPVEPVADPASVAGQSPFPAEKLAPEHPSRPDGVLPRTPAAAADDDDGWLDDAVAAPTPGGSKTEVDEEWVE